MDIVIIADFCSAFDHKGNNRFDYIANMFIKRKHNVEIITSDFYHRTKRKFDPIIEEYDGAKVTMLPEPPYSKNISIKRFLSHYKWGVNVYKYLKIRKKPDVVYCAMPTLKAASLAGKFCNKNGIKFIIDIQDLWPEAYKMVFNLPIISSIAFLPFKLIANSAYKKADEIVAVSQTYVDRAMMVNKKVNKGHSVFLGTDLNAFDENVKNTKNIEKKPDEIWMCYCGTLGASYDLKCVFSAMRIINIPNLKFIVMGDGPQQNEFKECAKDLNVEFLGKLPYQEMCGLLSFSDMVINPIKGKSAASIINKHADYAAIGKPVINSQDSIEYRKLVNDYNMGINCKNGDFVEMGQAIQWLIDHKNIGLEMGKNARKCAEELFDRNKTYKAIINLL